MATNKPKHILIAPLDWGLGHTTRCVPIIRYIRSLGHVPVVAGNASQLSFIKETFGDIDIIHLEGYNVRYSKWNKWGQIGLLSQLPRISATIRAEHEWLQQLVKERQIDGIISDNRYGLYHANIPCIMITHQLRVQTGMGQMADTIVQRLHYRYLQRFGNIWIPDVPGMPNLGGRLSHTAHMPAHACYIGLLSRFAGMDVGKAGDDLLILLSGPEPQRGDIASLLWEQAVAHKGKVTFVAGSDTADVPDHIPDHITYHKRIATNALAQILSAAGMVVCRSGYSTLMDLAVLNKKAILIPTPGQTEQEYLGNYLHRAGVFYTLQQKNADLENAIGEASSFPYLSPGVDSNYGLYQNVVREWLQREQL